MTMKLSHAEIEEQNSLSSFYYSLRQDTPARFWDKQCKSPLADDMAFKSVCKVLNLDPEDTSVRLAIRHIHLGKIDDVFHLVIPYPIPIEREWPDLFRGAALHLDIEQILLWNPKTDHVSIMGDETQPQLFGAITDNIYGQPKRFLQEWVRNIAIREVNNAVMMSQKWKSAPQEVDCCPGALIVGDLAKIHWPLSDMPKRIEVFDADPKKVSSAILKSANLPWCVQGK